MSYVSTVLAETGLVGFWELAEPSGTTATDQTGNSNGTYTAGVTLAQAGIPGGGGATAARFTAASSGKMTAPIVVAAVFTNTFTIECWVKRVTTGTQQVMFCGRTQSDTGSGPITYFGANNKLQLDKEDAVAIAPSTTTLTDTASWHHIVVTSSAGTTVKIWFDAVDVTGAVTSTTYNSESGTFTWGVGRAVDHTSSFYDGYMAMAALYNVAINSTQVANHYTLGSASPAGRGGFFGLMSKAHREWERRPSGIVVPRLWTPEPTYSM